MKDLKMLGGILAILVIVVPASWGVFTKTWEHKALCDRLAGLSAEFIGGQLRDNQKNVWQYQDRIKAHPDDSTAAERLRELELERKDLEFKRDGVIPEELKKKGPVK